MNKRTAARPRLAYFDTRIAVALALFVCVGCAFQIGPAYPERDGRTALEKQGYPTAAVEAVLSGGALDATQVVDLGASGSIDVRFLVARNPHLVPAQIDPFIKDRNDFVRSGAACNPNLTSNQVDTLAGDTSHTVLGQLAGNPSLTEAQLLDLHRIRKPGLLWFAFNPNCPDSIRTEILHSTDSLAQHWLKTTDEWKKSGQFVRGPDGRWRKP